MAKTPRKYLTPTKATKRTKLPSDRGCHYSNEELMAMLRVKAEQLGRAPKIQDVSTDENMPCPRTYLYRFGSWSKALASAGLSTDSCCQYTNKEILEILKAKAEQLGRPPKTQDVDTDENMPCSKTYFLRFGSWDKVLKLAGISSSSRYPNTDDELLEMLKAKAEQLGRTPTARDIYDNDDMPYPATYHRRFGSWNKALKAAGLSPNRRSPKKKTD